MNFLLIFICSAIVLSQFLAIQTMSDQIVIPPVMEEEQCFNDSCEIDYDPRYPLIQCSYLPREFMKCQGVEDMDGNNTAREQLGYGCTKFGGQRYEEVQRTRVQCGALPGIECYGSRQFLSRHTEPCVKYNGHYFVTTLIYSVLLGFLGVDRFCLGHTGTAVGKLLTLGGVGVWWIVDIILLVTGDLRPADNSNWVPYY